MSARARRIERERDGHRSVLEEIEAERGRGGRAAVDRAAVERWSRAATARAPPTHVCSLSRCDDRAATQTHTHNRLQRRLTIPRTNRNYTNSITKRERASSARAPKKQQKSTRPALTAQPSPALGHDGLRHIGRRSSWGQDVDHAKGEREKRQREREREREIGGETAAAAAPAAAAAARAAHPRPKPKKQRQKNRSRRSRTRWRARRRTRPRAGTSAC